MAKSLHLDDCQSRYITNWQQKTLATREVDSR